MEEEVMTEICYHAAQQNDRYSEVLISTSGLVLIEAVRGDYTWGSGLGHDATIYTRKDKLPGANKMGSILMAVRDRVVEDIQQKSAALYQEEIYTQAALYEDTPTYDVETYNMYQTLVNHPENDEINGHMDSGYNDSTKCYSRSGGRGRAKRHREKSSPSSNVLPLTKKAKAHTMQLNSQFEDAENIFLQDGEY
jgi:hypothetical protein